MKSNRRRMAKIEARGIPNFHGSAEKEPAGEMKKQQPTRQKEK